MAKLAIRLIVLSCLAFLGVASTARRAHAQACHLSELGPSSDLRFRVSAQAAFATYRTPVYAGEYQGYFGVASYVHPWVSAQASLGGYRIVRNGLPETGLGDLMLDVRATVWRPTDVLSLGLALGATAPTGDSGKGLGMGHAMLMPDAWLGLQTPTLRLLVELGYGRMLETGGGGGEHDHHSGTGSIVNPMNRSEIEHAVALSYLFWDPLFAAVRLYGAIPVAAANGESREIAALALGGNIARFELVVEQHLPLVGTPFQAKTLLRLAAAF